MRWLWRRLTRRRCSDEVEQAKQTLVEARNRLAATQLQGHEVTAAADKMRRDFADLLTEAMRGSHR